MILHMMAGIKKHRYAFKTLDGGVIQPLEICESTLAAAQKGDAGMGVCVWAVCMCVCVCV